MKTTIDTKNIILPLSWCLVNKPFYSRRKIIQLGKVQWVCLDNYLNTDDFIVWIEEVCTNKKILIRGINNDLAFHLSKLHFKKYLTGKEAFINLSNNLTWKPSVDMLIKRGRKHCSVNEFNYSTDNVQKLSELSSNSRHSSEPQLKNLFVTKFARHLRLFAAFDNQNKWLGAVLISKNSTKGHHTELLLKRINSQVGIMEYLITSVAEQLKKEGEYEFSLGEVPFVDTNFEDMPMAALIRKIQPYLNKVYNYNGLYFFKNKFSPEWRNTYLCANFDFSLNHIALLAIKTNLLRLVFYKFLKI